MMLAKDGEHQAFVSLIPLLLAQPLQRDIVARVKIVF
jgi:hypothetical protein